MSDTAKQPILDLSGPDRGRCMVCVSASLNIFGWLPLLIILVIGKTKLGWGVALATAAALSVLLTCFHALLWCKNVNPLFPKIMELANCIM